MRKYLSLILLFITNTLSAQTTSKLDTLPSGELMLTQSVQINCSLEEAWLAYTDTSIWKNWVTPVVEIDLKINGTIKSHYDSTALIGEKGTITNHILYYIPFKQICLQAQLNEHFPAFIKQEEKNLYSIVEFKRINDNNTQLILYGIGYKNETKWQNLVGFFIQGNEMSLNKLKTVLESN